METDDIIVQAANVLIHHTIGASSEEQIMGVETLYCEDKIYQLQVCLIPKHIHSKKEDISTVYDGIESGYSLNISSLIESVHRIKTDGGLGEFTDINYTVQYLHVQGYKYLLELRMTTTRPQLIQFEQLN